MKPTLIDLIATIKLSSAITLLLAFSSCSKESIRKCEKWEVEDIGHIKEGCWLDLSCGRRTLQLRFCGDKLNDAKVGNTITTYETDCCKTTRTFIRKVQ